MNSRDLDRLLPALDAATGYPWCCCVTGRGSLWLWPCGTRRPLALVDTWVDHRPGPADPLVRRVLLRSRFYALADDYRDVAPGRGWAERAAAAVVEMLEARL